MPQARSKSVAASVPWWLAVGEEECPHCSRLYFVEVEVRCSACDGPTCPHCKVRHSEGHLVCPDCVESESHG